MIKNCKIGKNVVFEDRNNTKLIDCIIGDNTYIGSYTKLVNTKIGNNCKIFNFVNLYGPNLIIGDNCKIGTFVEIQKDTKIGDCCIISSHSFICSGVTLEGNNFIGHHCCFSNDKNPKAFNAAYTLERTFIGWDTNIGSGSNLLPVKIGGNVLIGMGSIVTKDIPSNCVAFSKKSAAEIYKYDK